LLYQYARDVALVFTLQKAPDSRTSDFQALVAEQGQKPSKYRKGRVERHHYEQPHNWPGESHSTCSVGG
jgi:hypothetical protein